MTDIVKMLITVVCAVVASNGFWSFISQFSKKATARDKMLIAIGHDRIMALGQEYIRRGEITPDEYENLLCLYEPYTKLGGNGSGARMMREVDNMRIVNQHSVCSKIDEKRIINDE